MEEERLLDCYGRRSIDTRKDYSDGRGYPDWGGQARDRHEKVYKVWKHSGARLLPGRYRTAPSWLMAIFPGSSPYKSRSCYSRLKYKRGRASGPSGRALHREQPACGWTDMGGEYGCHFEFGAWGTSYCSKMFIVGWKEISVNPPDY